MVTRAVKLGPGGVRGCVCAPRLDDSSTPADGRCSVLRLRFLGASVLNCDVCGLMAVLLSSGQVVQLRDRAAAESAEEWLGSSAVRASVLPDKLVSPGFS